MPLTRLSCAGAARAKRYLCRHSPRFLFTNDSSAFPPLVEYSVSYYTTFDPPYFGIEEYI
jgi:hypothetical protein